MKRAGVRLMAELLFVLHTALMAVIVIGWLLPPPYYYLYVAVVAVTFITQLIFRYCLLTEWEFHFRRILDPSIGPSPYFLTYYSHKTFPGWVTDRLVDRLSLVFLSVSLAFAALHMAGVL